jgi:hypothetical protein
MTDPIIERQPEPAAVSASGSSRSSANVSRSGGNLVAKSVIAFGGLAYLASFTMTAWQDLDCTLGAALCYRYGGFVVFWWAIPSGAFLAMLANPLIWVAFGAAARGRARLAASLALAATVCAGVGCLLFAMDHDYYGLREGVAVWVGSMALVAAGAASISLMRRGTRADSGSSGEVASQTITP